MIGQETAAGNVQARDVLLETLAFADALDELLELRALLERGAVHDLPVVEHELRERLSRRRLSELACSEGVSDLRSTKSRRAKYR